MNIYDTVTVAEYGHIDTAGHEIGVSAERVGGCFPQVWLSVLNYVTDAAGNPEPDLHLSPAQARDLGASLLLAADHADGRIG